MDVYRLSFKAANGNVVPLPGNFNKHAPAEDLRAFAAKHGYDASKWGASHDETLTAFFGNAALQKIEDPEVLQNVKLDRFFQAVKEESGLFDLDPAVFQKRFREGALKTVIDGNDKLIATLNVLPKLSKGLKHHLNIENHPQNPQVYEVGAGFAARSHRGLGLYSLTRDEVIQSEGVSSKLMFSQNYGKGASSVNRRAGWTLVNWPEFPFASALMAWPKDTEGFVGGKLQLTNGLLLDLPENGFYKGDNISFEPKTKGALSAQAKRFLDKHDWNKSHHLWVNDLDKLEKFEEHLRAELGVPKGADSNIVAFVYKQWLQAIRKNSFLVNREDPTNGNGWQEFASGGQQHSAPTAAAE